MKYTFPLCFLLLQSRFLISVDTSREISGKHGTQSLAVVHSLLPHRFVPVRIESYSNGTEYLLHASSLGLSDCSRMIVLTCLLAHGPAAFAFPASSNLCCRYRRQEGVDFHR